MKSYEKIGYRIIEQIEEQDFEFFSSIGVDSKSATPINPKGTNGGIQFNIPDKDIFKIEIVLSAADLYNVKAYKKSDIPINVINIRTKKPIAANIVDKTIEVRDVFAFPIVGDPCLIDVLEALFFQDAETAKDFKKIWMGPKPVCCDLCKREFIATDTFIDGQHKDGAYAIFCERCHVTHGVGIGYISGRKYLWDTGEKIE